MGRTYRFNDVEVKTLNELGEAYAAHFVLGLEDIRKNTRKLIKFIKSINRKTAKEIASLFVSCKYRNTVLSLLIFRLCEDKRVVINGKIFTFREFTEALAQKEGVRALYAFMEDLGVSRTYATLNIEPFLEGDSYFIERNISDPFVLEYLTTYYQFDYVESLQSFISNVFIYDEERFRRSLKIFRNDRFQFLLAHKVGFKAVYHMRNLEMPVFEAVKLLRCEFSEQDLSRLISDTFFWWLLDNFDKYKYKGASKKLFKQFKELQKRKKRYDKKPDFLTFVELSSELYDNYICFIDDMRNGRITVKKKFDETQYIMDKAYCRTFICLEYMKSHTVKLPKENLAEEISIKDTEEAVPEDMDLEEEAPAVLPSSELSPKTLKKQEKLISKVRRFGGFVIAFTLMFMVFVAVVLLLDKLLAEDGGFSLPENSLESPILFTFIGAGLVNIVLCIVLRLCASKTQNALNEYMFLTHLKKQDTALTASQEKRLSRLKEGEELFKKRAMKSHRILSCCIAVLFGFTVSTVGVCLMTLLSSAISLPLDWEKAYLLQKNKMFYFGIGPLFGLFYGILRKRKGALTSVLLLAVSLGSVVLLAFLL